MRIKYLARTSAKGQSYYYYRRKRRWFPLPDPSHEDFASEYARIHQRFERREDTRRYPPGDYLYCVGPNGGHNKLGITKNITRRIYTLRNGNSRKLRLKRIWWTPTREAAVQLEAALHIALRDHLVRGEWFDVAVDALARQVLELASALRFEIKEMVTSGNAVST